MGRWVKGVMVIRECTCDGCQAWYVSVDFTHCIVHLKLILHSMLTTLEFKNLKKKKAMSSDTCDLLLTGIRSGVNLPRE